MHHGGTDIDVLNRPGRSGLRRMARPCRANTPLGDGRHVAGLGAGWPGRPRARRAGDLSLWPRLPSLHQDGTDVVRGLVMHEFSIAMGIAELAAEEAARLRSSR